MLFSLPRTSPDDGKGKTKKRKIRLSVLMSVLWSPNINLVQQSVSCDLFNQETDPSTLCLLFLRPAPKHELFMQNICSRSHLWASAPRTCLLGPSILGEEGMEERRTR